MRSTGMLILLAMLMAFFAGQVLAQDAMNATAAVADLNVMNVMNATNTTNATNVTAPMAPVTPMNVTEVPSEAAPQTVMETAPSAAPQETASRFTQLSNYTKGTSAVLGENIPAGYSDVTVAADTSEVFSREAGVPAPSVKVIISKVNTAEDKYVQIANQAVGAWDLTGWMLESAGNTTYTFPAFSLDSGISVKVHEGNGFGTATDMYTNSTAPLWINNVVTLKDATGNVISSYDISTAPPEPIGYVDPLAGRIQY